jgi:hypothetical protein
MYSPSMDWTEWKNLQKAVKAKGKVIYLISTEFSRVGGKSQIQRSRAMANSHLEAWANGMRWITYFNVKANTSTPVLREAAPGSGFQWLQNVKRPKASNVIIKSKRKLTSSLMPLLQTMTYYNLAQNFEGAEFQTTLHPSNDTVVYVFSRKGKTICAFHLTKQKSPQNLAILTDVPFISQDLFGKTNRITPNSTAIVSATKNPTVIIFDKEIPQLYKEQTAKKVIKAVGSVENTPVLARGTVTDLKLQIPGVFKKFSAKVIGSIDNTKTKAVKVKIADNRPTEIKLPLTIDKKIKPGTYTFENRIYDGKKLVGIMRLPITISDVISLNIEGVPKLPQQEPAIAVTVVNLSDKAISGEVSLDNIYFGGSFIWIVMERILSYF